MQEFPRYILLGLVQGLTEFLPVSSSAHLVFFQHFLRLDPPGVVLEGALHLGTLLAVLVYFRREVLSLTSRVLRGEKGALRYLGLLALGTLPVAVVGILFSDEVEAAFGSVRLAAGLLLVTAAFLAAAEVGLRKGGGLPLGLSRAAAIGGAQALSLFPGISRSGITISTALILGVGPEDAVRFSFLLSIPAIAGAGAFAILGAGGTSLSGAELLGIALGGAAAFASGLSAIKVLLALLYRRGLWPFALYCSVLGLVVLLVAGT